MDWSASPSIGNICDEESGADIAGNDLEAALACWYAGLEFELGGIFGTIGTNEEAKHLGIGGPPARLSKRAEAGFALPLVAWACWGKGSAGC